MKTWSVGGIEMEYPIIVGAGVCKTPDSSDAYQHPDLPLGAVVSGSYTKDVREGNTHQPLSAWIGEIHSGFNAYGMPNMGLTASCRLFKQKQMHRPLILSFAGFSPEEYSYSIGFCHGDIRTSAITGLELNFGCPNVHDQKKLPLSYDPEGLSVTFERCAKLFSGISATDRIPVWIKMSPYLLKENVDILKAYGVDTRSVPYFSQDYIDDIVMLIRAQEPYVRAVVTSNTIPNCRYVNDKGGWVTGPNDGQAGLSGALLKNIALEQVRLFREALPASMDVIGGGGILTGDDAMEFFGAGARGVFCTSLPYWHGGPKAFVSLIEQSESLQNFLLSGM